MDFYSVYMQAASSKKIANIECSPELLIPNRYVYDLGLGGFSQDSFLHCLAGGNVHCKQPFSFAYEALPCGLLLYAKSGLGTLKSNGKRIECKKNQMLFFDCRQPFSLESTILPWNFQLCFVQGGNLVLYLSLLDAKQGAVFDISELSPLPKQFHLLLRSPDSAGFADFMEMQMLLNDILSTLCLSIYKKPKNIPASVPPYLLDLKDHLDHHYEEPFLLENCQETYGINKYRICREFSLYFGSPPLRYLNHVRIEKAKEMLLNTDMTVHEISSKTGFENVNHFINLFKRNTSLTPYVFKQTVPADRPSLRSPSQ